MTDSNLQNTVPDGAFAIGSKSTDDFTKNEEVKNLGIKDVPRMIINALNKPSGTILFPSQITEEAVDNFQEGVQNVPLLREEDEQTSRAILAAGLDLTENTINFAGRAIGGLSGNKYTAKDFFDNEKLGVYIPEEDENSFTYNLTKFGVQYGVPYTAVFKFLGSIGLSNFVWKDVLAGGTTASVFFDTFDKNLSNYIQDTPLANPVTKLLAAETEEESNVAKETIKKFIEGGVTAKIVNKTFDAVLNPRKVADAFINVVENFKKSPQTAKNLIFNLQQSRFNKFSNVRKYNSMDEVLRNSDDIVEVAPVTDEVVTKAPPQTPARLDLPDTRGKGKFYHGSSEEITLFEGGEAVSSQNIYGNGFYATDDLITGSKYQKKGKKQILKPEIPIAKGIKKESDLPYGIQSDLNKLDITDTELNQLVKPGIEVPPPDRLRQLANQARQFPIDNPFSDGKRTISENFNKIADRLDELATNPPKSPEFKPVTYEITEKQPVNFYDLDQPIDADLKNFVDNFDDSPFEDIVSLAANDLGDSYTLTELFDEIREYSKGRNITSNVVIDEIFDNFQEYFKGKGFGGFTHQGGKKAGKGKRLHQVKIYFDPANQININKVDLNQFGTVAGDSELVTRKNIRRKKGKQKFQTTDTPVGFEGRNMNLFSDDPKEVAKIKACLLYTSPSPRDKRQSRMPSSA